MQTCNQRLGAGACILTLVTSFGCSAPKRDYNGSQAGNAGQDSSESSGGTSAEGGTSGKTATTTGGRSTVTRGGSHATGGAKASGGTNSASSTAGGVGSGGTMSSESSTGGANASGGTNSASSTTGGAGSGGTSSSVSSTGGTAPSGGSTSTGTTTPTLVIATPTLGNAKTYVAYTGSITATGAANYSWSIASGSLPAGLTLQNSTSATVTIGGTPLEAGVFPVKLAVTDGSRATTVDIPVAVTHNVAFLSDRITNGVPELFLSEVGGEKNADAVRLNTPLVSGGISQFAWSPNGEKIAYLLANGELRVTNVATPATSSNIAYSVVGFRWLPGTSTLALYTASTVGIVDLTATPITVRSLALPIGSTPRSISGILPANSGKGLCLVTIPDPVNSGASDVYVASWVTTTTVTLSLLRSSQTSTSCVAYSSDSAFVTTASGDGGLKVYNVSNQSGYTVAYPSTSYWAPNSNTLVTYYNALPPIGLNFNRLTASANAVTTIVNDKDSNSVPGPWSPNGAHLLYTYKNADLMTLANAETAAADSAYTLLPADFTTNTFTGIAEYSWSPDSSWVALRADRYDDAINDLFLVRWSAKGVATRPYSSRLAPGVSSYRFSPATTGIAYVGILNSATVPQLYVSQLPATGPATAAIQASTNSGPAVQNDIAWLPGSRVILYRANDSGGYQLHNVLLTASGAVSNALNTSGASGSGVSSYQVAPIR